MMTSIQGCHKCEKKKRLEGITENFLKNGVGQWDYATFLPLQYLPNFFDDVMSLLKFFNLMKKIILRLFRLKETIYCSLKKYQCAT